MALSSENGGLTMAGKRGNNEGSIRQRSDGRWEARVTVGINPATGKPERRSIYGKTQAEVRKQMTQILNALDTGTYQRPDKTTVSKWMYEWIDTFCANKVKPLTLASYRGIIKNHINPHIGSLELQSVRGLHIQRLYNDMTENGSSGKTVKNVGAILHKAFAVAIKQGILQFNPCDGAELPKVQKHEITPLADDEIPAFLNALNDEPMGNAYALCLLAGLREGECLGLSWAQVDFAKKRITISQQLQKEKKKGGQYYIASTTKSGKPRIIEPPAIAFEYLRAEQTRQLQNRLQAGSEWTNHNNLVFTNELGEHYKIFTFYSRFKRIAASIGRPDARPHDLRHTAATVAIASGADIKSVQDMLGHATASFTLNVYAHTSEQMMKDTASRVQGYYDSIGRRA